MEVGLMKIILCVNGSWIDENKLHIKLPIQFNKYVMLHSYSSGGKSSGGKCGERIFRGRIVRFPITVNPLRDMGHICPMSEKSAWIY